MGYSDSIPPQWQWDEFTRMSHMWFEGHCYAVKTQKIPKVSHISCPTNATVGWKIRVEKGHPSLCSICYGDPIVVKAKFQKMYQEMFKDMEWQKS